MSDTFVASPLAKTCGRSPPSPVE